MTTHKTPKDNASGKSFWRSFKEFIHNERLQFIVGLGCLMLAFFMFLAFSSFLLNGGADQSQLEPVVTESKVNAEDVAVKNSTGIRGAYIAEFLINQCFGISSYAIVVFLAILGFNLMRTHHFHLKSWGISCASILIWGSLFMSFTVERLLPESSIYWGGYHGHNAISWLETQIGNPGIVILLLVTAILYAFYISSMGTISFIRKLFHPKAVLPGKDEEESAPVEEKHEEDTKEPHFAETVQEPQAKENIADTVKETLDKNTATADANTTDEEIPMEIELPIEESAVEQPSKSEEQVNSEPAFTIEAGVEEETGKIIEPYNPKLDLSHYKYPVIDLLEKSENNAPIINNEEQTENKNRIIEALRNFNIEISSIKATVGPTITLYEITPAPGVRIAKIKNLEDDIALSLKALSTRIIAPIPGKGTIGIEIPNSRPQIVSMRSIINSRKFQESTYELPVAIGKTITNEIFMFDLCKMPHLLVAGATGMGKSVGLNAIITSLLYKKHPSELKFVMVDPKKVELSIYSPIEKHFLAKLPDGDDAIITDVTKVVQTLKSLCTEMDTRYDLLKKAAVRNIREYNEKFINRHLNPEQGHKYMPYIVVIIDEFGDLIMTAGKEIEMPIARIAQLARAVGIHMIIATQRPTTNIITGTIKANFPARIAFRVASMMDSRTILDRPGANQLIGRGDMLFLQGSDPIRIQCAFVDTPEVSRISEFISKQQGYPNAFYLPEYVDENSTDGGLGENVDMNHLDPMFQEAARLIVIHQQGSTSLIQRKFSIGYNRAGRIMDQLERAGIVGPSEGSKPRQVLCADEMDLEAKLSGMNGIG